MGIYTNAINKIIGSAAAAAIGLSKSLDKDEDEEEKEEKEIKAVESITSTKDVEMRDKALKNAQQKINSTYDTKYLLEERKKEISEAEVKLASGLSVIEEEK